MQCLLGPLTVCHSRFPAAICIQTDGRSLIGVPSQSIDFVWSYDCLVHLDADVIACYMEEIARVLSKGGTAILHHPNRTDEPRHDSGWRGQVTKEFVAFSAKAWGLDVVRQTDTWGSSGEYNCKLYGNVITVLAKPQS